MGQHSTPQSLRKGISSNQVSFWQTRHDPFVNRRLLSFQFLAKFIIPLLFNYSYYRRWFSYFWDTRFSDIELSQQQLPLIINSPGLQLNSMRWSRYFKPVPRRAMYTTWGGDTVFSIPHFYRIRQLGDIIPSLRIFKLNSIVFVVLDILLPQHGPERPP